MFRVKSLVLAILPMLVLTMQVHASPRIIRTISEARSLSHTDFCTPIPFELQGQLLSTLNKTSFVIDDGGQRVMLHLPKDRAGDLTANVQAGDMLTVRGHTGLQRGFIDELMVDSVKVAGHRELPPPEHATVDSVLEGRHDLKFATVRGEVSAMFKDELSDDWHYGILRDGEKRMYFAVLSDVCNPSRIDGITGKTIEVSGLCGSLFGMRRFIRPGIVAESTSAIRIVRESPDPFNVPDLENPQSMSIDDVMRLGHRKICGRVIARWAGKRILVKTSEGRIVQVDLAPGDVRPAPGESVCASGFATTDFFRLNLEDAVVRKLTDASAPAAEARVVGEEQFVSDIKRLRNKVLYLGKSVCVTGIVNRILRTEDSDTRIDLDVRGMRMMADLDPKLIPTDAISPGCKVEVTGTFVTEGGNWQRDTHFPRITDWSLVVNFPEDICVVAHPPWWTFGKLIAVIAVLFIALAASAGWIYALRLLANRRGRELYREQIALASAQLRVDERTRLAAELHDSLSQNLSGIACQINVAKLTTGDGETKNLLATAERMLQSSRTELTRCISDLRCDTLEEPDFDTAIRKNLGMLALPAAIHVRFNVPRARVSDSTAHAILCIVRELVTNAVRHGKATSAEVAGSIDGNHLSFSVIDNGCGFEVASRPGVRDGHFGLSGIKDRVNRLNGSFDLRSEPGNGTVAQVTIPFPFNKQQHQSPSPHV